MCHGACNQAIVDAMAGPTRPTAVVLFIHNGLPGHAHLKVLQDAGLRVSVTHAAAAVAAAKTQQPDVIVLDSDCDSDVSAQLKRDQATRHIPVIALVNLIPPR
jgi:PleD family two-component response regulator